MKKVYLHVDMDAFFASVEQHDHPEYRGKPVIVGSPPDKRGVVSAASYEARKFGIHSAMPSREAGRRCPDGIFLPGNMKRYSDVSKQIMTIFERFTPWVEPLSVDEAFLDVTGSQRIFGSGPEIAAKIRATVKEETGLTASVGVAPNKFLAKLASDMDKPDGLTIVPVDPEAIIALLAPLPVGRIWGVGKVSQKKLESVGLRFIRDLQNCPIERLQSLLGANSAAQLKQLASGTDSRDISTGHVEKSVSGEHTFGKDCSDPNQIREALLQLCEEVGVRLRKQKKYAGTVTLKLRWDTFETITRQQRLNRPCNDNIRLREIALQIFEKNYQHRPVRLIGFGASKLCDHPGRQLDLFESAPGEDRDRPTQISRTLDTINQKYGRHTIGRAGRGDKIRRRRDS